MTLILPVACNRDCGGGCPLVATVRDGRVVRIANNPAGGPFLKGCVRGYRAYLQQQSPARLTAPLVRTGSRGSGQFREAEWGEAIGLVADGLARVREKHGDDAVIALSGSGSCRGAVHDTGALTARFLNLTGGHVEESNTYSSAAASFVEPVVLGTNEAGVDPATLQHSGMIVLWGANLVDCIMGCEWRARVRQAKRRGVPVVVIDPRRTETAKQLSTEWLPVRPGTDSALMLAVLHVLITEDLVDEAFVATHATGWDLLRARVLGEGAPGVAGGAPDAGSALPPGQAATPEWAEGVCGTPAARIVALAREWARRRPTALIPGLAMQRTWGGEEPVRLAIALQVATGNLGRRGGSSGAQTWGGLPGSRFEGIPVPPNSVSASVAENDWAEAVLHEVEGRVAASGGTGGPVRICAAYNCGGNYVAQAADVRKSVRAMEALEFSVCHDLFMTATARYCDVVLPVTHWLERDDAIFTSANYMLYSHKVATPPGQAMDDYDVFAALATRCGVGGAFTKGKDAAAWLRDLIEWSEIPDADEFRAAGVYFAPEQERVGLAAFADEPERYALSTPSGKVELAGAACVAAGLSEIPEARVLTADDARPLRLVTPKSRFRVHSQLDDLPWFTERDDRSLWLSPRDAAARGVADGDQVVASSAHGATRCACRVTDDVMPGVVSLCEGIEPALDDDGVDTAGAANVLTSDEPTLPSHGATMHSALVEVAPAEGAPPT
jgi:anaerobic dimethyl sulfoxide reductase subunit A